MEAWMVGQEELVEDETELLTLCLDVPGVSGPDLINESPDRSTILRHGLTRKVGFKKFSKFQNSFIFLFTKSKSDNS